MTGQDSWWCLNIRTFHCRKSHQGQLWQWNQTQQLDRSCTDLDCQFDSKFVRAGNTKSSFDTDFWCKFSRLKLLDHHCTALSCNDDNTARRSSQRIPVCIYTLHVDRRHLSWTHNRDSDKVRLCLVHSKHLLCCGIEVKRNRNRKFLKAKKAFRIDKVLESNVDGTFLIHGDKILRVFLRRNTEKREKFQLFLKTFRHFQAQMNHANLALWNCIFVERQKFPIDAGTPRIKFKASVFFRPVNFSFGTLLKLFTFAKPVCWLHALLGRNWVQILTHFTWTSIENLVTCRSRVQLYFPRRTFTLSMTCHAVQNWTKFHRFRTRITKREDFKALLQRRIVDVLPAVCWIFGTRIHVSVGPWWWGYCITGNLKFLINGSDEYHHINIIHHRSAKMKQ